QTAKLQAVAAEEQTVAKAESATAKADAKAPRTAPADPNPDGNLLNPADIGKAGRVKDVAEMAVELITSNHNPGGVLEALLKLLKDHNTISKTTERGLDHVGPRARQGRLVHSAPCVRQRTGLFCAQGPGSAPCAKRTGLSAPRVRFGPVRFPSARGSLLRASPRAPLAPVE